MSLASTEVAEIRGMLTTAKSANDPLIEKAIAHLESGNLLVEEMAQVSSIKETVEGIGGTYDLLLGILPTTE